MYFTGFADEAALGIDGQIEVTKALGWKFIEARQIDKVNIHDIPEEKFEEVCAKLADAGILTVKVGLVEGKVIDAKEVEALASLPSREVLIAKLLGSMQAPISGTVGVLQGVIRNAVYVLDAIRQQKASA